jgi:hypothetical protein
MMGKAISEKQPWGYLLCTGIKDIENRTWPLPEKYIGERILIHTSAKAAGKILSLLSEKQQAALWWHLLTNRVYDRKEEDLDCGAIIGSVRFVDCVINHESIWAEKTEISTEWGKDLEIIVDDKPIYNWVTTDAILFNKPILNVKGRLGFWDVPNEIMKQIKENNEILNNI